MGLNRRYSVLPPSTFGAVDFSAKLKGALGMSKTKNLLVPRFKAISNLAEKVKAFATQNSVFERQLWELGEKNNLLKSPSFRDNVSKGLGYLEHEGWLSDKEHQTYLKKLLS
jgi:hypothetical protein